VFQVGVLAGGNGVPGVDMKISHYLHGPAPYHNLPPVTRNAVLP
jgi:hypothetical protein